ncbi:TIGR02450 family Trp-rich protein [Luminiphilus sp. nBUS_16]|uniref:TIGR02450 family Trp-rich protein n=1 Tax=unclassified Luminiphilus TaxID=2633198 RepID=UPI003EBA3B49|tara:strand:+ start:813 stop:1028 length:216 start_codon:yes stop_codon:yes gene_type:complete
MNPIHPKKLLNSKWTAVRPINKEKHFVVSRVEYDEEGLVIECELNAVMSNRFIQIEWSTLKEREVWLQGWQ